MKLVLVTNEEMKLFLTEPNADCILYNYDQYILSKMAGWVE